MSRSRWLLRIGRQRPADLLRRALCGLIVVTALHSAQGHAQAQGIVDQRFLMTVQPLYGVSRGHAPLALSVALNWTAPQLMEGQLQLDWYVDETRLGGYVASDLAFSDSTRQFDVLLPPVILPYDEAIFSVQARFRSTDGTLYDLDVHDVALQPDWRRILLVAVCTTPGPATARSGGGTGLSRSNALARAFRLEPFFADRFTRRELQVDNTEIDPEDVPTAPLQLTAFDLFVIPGESLTKLKPRQLESLLSWVRAGGSLCVFVDAALPPTHLDWLNQLAGRDQSDAAFLPGTDGKVLPAGESFAGLALHHVDFGRAVTIVGDPRLAEEQWRQMVQFLWKVREDRRQETQQGKFWSLLSAEPEADFAMHSPLGPQRFLRQPELTKLLLPESVSGLPLSTVGLVLAVFLLVISPGDYYLLGWLGRRRWTWLLFPSVTLLFTGYTMWMAAQHLGQTSYEHSISIVDVGAAGRPVRTSRFEMLYAASNRLSTSPLQQQLMVPLDPDVDRLVRSMLEPRAPREYEPPWRFTGRVPQKYVIQRDVQQWSPRMARLTSFGPGERALPAADAAACRLRMTAGGTQVLQQNATIPTAIVALAERVTRRPAEGYFSVVSQLSPTCGGNWEDLTVLDNSDPAAQVDVEVTSPAEGEYLIVRRLHREAN